MKKVIIYILGTIVLIFLIVSVIYIYRMDKVKVTENNTNLDKSIVTNKSISAKGQHPYKVQLSLNSGISKPKPYSFDYTTSYVGNYLMEVLELGKPVSTASFKKLIPSIVYDSTQGSPYGDNNNRFNHNYYIFLEPEVTSLDTQKVYLNDEFKATVSDVDAKLLPYIQDSNYCEMDTDCSVGYNFCSYGSYNKFRTYIDIWGCEGTQYPQENESELYAICAIAKQSPEVKYIGSKCVSNKCVAQNREVVCKNGGFP